MITDIRKKKIYENIEDRKIKMLMGRAFKDFSESEVAIFIQEIVRLFPMTRRFDEKTFKILNDNKDNEHFLDLLKDKIKGQRDNSRRC